MTNQTKGPKQKLTLTVRALGTLESRASPTTTCPDSNETRCLNLTEDIPSAKLTAVAFF